MSVYLRSTWAYLKTDLMFSLLNNKQQKMWESECDKAIWNSL